MIQLSPLQKAVLLATVRNTQPVYIARWQLQGYNDACPVTLQ